MLTLETKLLLSLPSSMLSLVMFIYAEIVIMLMLFLEQARGRPTWSWGAALFLAGTMLVTPALG